MSADEHVCENGTGEHCERCAERELPRERPERSAPYVVPPGVRTVRAMRNRRRVIE